MKKLITLLINFYQKFLSLDTGIPKKLGISKGYVCMHYPTCSEYTKQAVVKYGVYRGLVLGSKRVYSCRPGQDPKIDILK
jgi:putative component of membrane protein insertase Oxa1/YidC/SpoIIIJ protein YidD